MNERRHVILFSPRFAAAVERGEKTSTIRRLRKRPISVGDTLDLRAWSGLPYRSKQRKLRVEKCLDIGPITIGALPGVFLRHGEILEPNVADCLARWDGFADRFDLQNWFRDVHGLPFAGVHMMWKL